MKYERHKSINTPSSHVHEISRIGTFRKREKAEQSLPELETVNHFYCLIDTNLSIEDNAKILIRNVDVYTTQRDYLISL